MSFILTRSGIVTWYIILWWGWWDLKLKWCEFGDFCGNGGGSGGFFMGSTRRPIDLVESNNQSSWICVRPYMNNPNKRKPVGGVLGMCYILCMSSSVWAPAPGAQGGNAPNFFFSGHIFSPSRHIFGMTYFRDHMILGGFLAHGFLPMVFYFRLRNLGFGLI
jgi:hypothetical protein